MRKRPPARPTDTGLSPARARPAPPAADLLLEVRLDEAAPAGDVLPALARLLRTLARREREERRGQAGNGDRRK